MLTRKGYSIAYGNYLFNKYLEGMGTGKIMKKDGSYKFFKVGEFYLNIKLNIVVVVDNVYLDAEGYSRVETTIVMSQPGFTHSVGEKLNICNPDVWKHLDSNMDIISELEDQK